MRGVVTLARLAVNRAVATPGFLAVRLFGTLVAVALVSGVALYVPATGDAILRANLNQDPNNASLTVSNIQRPLTGTTYRALDRYIRSGEGADLGLPLRDLHVHHYTGTVPIYRAGSAPGSLRGPMLDQLALHYYEGFASRVRLLAGGYTLPPSARRGDVPVVVSRYTARSLRLRVDDRLAVSLHGRRSAVPPLVVAGIYAPRDVDSPFWDENAGSPTYRSLVVPNLAPFLALADRADIFGPDYFWSSRVDIASVHLASAGDLLGNITRVGNRLAEIAPGTLLLTSLDGDVANFQAQYSLLPVILLILVAPIVALVLYAVATTTGLVLDRQAGEIVLLRGRGATTGQIFALYAVEGLILGATATLAGPLLGLPLARLIGNASGFLAFSGGLPLELRLTWPAFLAGAGAAFLALLAGLIPALALSRRSMVAFKQEQARTRPPLWQRLFLDLAILALALYGLSVLARQGPITTGATATTVARDPLLAVAPLLFAIAIMLLVSRVVPRLAGIGVDLLGRFSSPSAHVALRGVARAPRQPMRLVQLSTLTLTLGVFAATVAGIETNNRADQQMYQAGAALRLEESFDRAHSLEQDRNAPDIMPLAAHRALPDVRGVTPALRFETSGDAANTVDGQDVNVLGIDPRTAGGVMWFRPDFSAIPFARLLAALAAPAPGSGRRDDAIVSASLLQATGLRQGDRFNLTLASGATIPLRVAATARYFPSLDPRATPFVVANLAYLAPRSHSFGPNEVWLATDQSRGALGRIARVVASWPRQVIAYPGTAPAFSVREAPFTAGIYGVVSIGFLIAAALALLGFIAYAYLSLQRRMSEFAIVRALGLSTGQVRSLILLEQVFLLGTGLLGGLIAGLLTTRLFLPYLPFAADTTPPFLVVMPWKDIGLFALAVALAALAVLGAHASLVLRLEVGRVLRLGEG